MSSVPGARQASHATRKVIAVGVNLASVSQVRRSLRELGESYLERIFTSGEVSHCLQGADPAAQLADMLAAKEAVIKVLACAEAEVQAPWTAIELSPRQEGGFEVRLAGLASDFAELRGIDSFALNVSRYEDLATAVVFALGAG
jgi:phosphopantetheine--protein transferase-like protein